MNSSNLPRAVLWALVCVLALGAVAFWPAPRWVTPHRPSLKAPIVFDELLNLPAPAPADTGVSQGH